MKKVKREHLAAQISSQFTRSILCLIIKQCDILFQIFTNKVYKHAENIPMTMKKILFPVIDETGLPVSALSRFVSCGDESLGDTFVEVMTMIV